MTGYDSGDDSDDDDDDEDDEDDRVCLSASLCLCLSHAFSLF